MEKVFFFTMDMLLHNHKGFTLLECLLTLLIISSMMVLMLKNQNSVDLSHIYFLNEYLDGQANALTNKESFALSKTYTDQVISFNAQGRVNRANTIRFKNHEITIHLGTGYASIQ